VAVPGVLSRPFRRQVGTLIFKIRASSSTVAYAAGLSTFWTGTVGANVSPVESTKTSRYHSSSVSDASSVVMSRAAGSEGSASTGESVIVSISVQSASSASAVAAS
jgi:hypothetical protein